MVPVNLIFFNMKSKPYSLQLNITTKLAIKNYSNFNYKKIFLALPKIISPILITLMINKLFILKIRFFSKNIMYIFLIF